MSLVQQLLGNFKDILKSPKNLSLGLITQTLIVPIVGVVVAYLSPVSEIYKVGIILVSCVPSAVMSNYLTKSIKGNVALSISLTASLFATFFYYYTYHTRYWFEFNKL